MINDRVKFIHGAVAASDSDTTSSPTGLHGIPPTNDTTMIITGIILATLCFAIGGFIGAVHYLKVRKNRINNSSAAEIHIEESQITHF